MKYKPRKEKHNLLYVVIHLESKEAFIYKEITPLSEKLNLDRSTIYRKFDKEGDNWIKNGFQVYKTSNIFIKSRRGK